MELVYLWVEDYKNIYHQGFNFSPRFKCEYDEEKNELTIDENKEYVSIFPENINVTAIVGKNGSGKSSILELLPYSEKIQEANKLTFLLFKKNDEYIILKPSAKEIKINKDFWEKIKEEDIKKFNFSKLNEIRQITYDTDFTKENFIDEDIFQYLQSLIKFGFSFKESYLENNNKIFNIEKYKHISNLLTYILKDELINLNVFFIPTYIKISNQDKSYANLKIEEAIEKLRNKEDVKQFVEQLENNKDLLKKFKYNQKIAIRELDKIKILFELPIQDYFHINFYNEKDISFSDFSQGERNFYNHFLFLLYLNKNHSKSNEKENTFFLIDEPDTTFHPNWQKKYINQLLSIYKNYKKNIHLIITSHSPFILSDLPKNNVIFLKEGKQIDVDINPFGANIHTLLSHGFFMENGLMGEFAKSKIDNIIENLKDKKFNPTKEEKIKIFTTIKMIGEEFLKTKLLDMYYKKFDDDFIKKQRKEELEKLQEKISKELKQL